MAPLSSLALRIFLASAWLLAGPTFAGTKFDLSPYLGNLPQEGDFKVFSRSTGGERRVTVLELKPWKLGWKGRFSSEVTGAGEDFDGTVISEDYLIPGQRLLSGNEFYDSGLSFLVRKPVKGLKLLVTPGKAQRISQKALAVFDDIKVGKVDRRSTWSLEGFETVETPSGTTEDALRAESSSKTRLRTIGGALACSKGACGRKLVNMMHQTLWYAAGSGLVRADTDLELFVDGSFIDGTSWSEELSSFGNVDDAP